MPTPHKTTVDHREKNSKEKKSKEKKRKEKQYLCEPLNTTGVYDPDVFFNPVVPLFGTPARPDMIQYETEFVPDPINDPEFVQHENKPLDMTVTHEVLQKLHTQYAGDNYTRIVTLYEWERHRDHPEKSDLQMSFRDNWMPDQFGVQPIRLHRFNEKTQSMEYHISIAGSFPGRDGSTGKNILYDSGRKPSNKMDELHLEQTFMFTSKSDDDVVLACFDANYPFQRKASGECSFFTISAAVSLYAGVNPSSRQMNRKGVFWLAQKCYKPVSLPPIDELLQIVSDERSIPTPYKPLLFNKISVKT